MINIFKKIIYTSILLSVTQLAIAYDPISSIKGSTIVSGSRYSEQTAYSAISTTSTQLFNENETWRANIALPLYTHTYYSFADIDGIDKRIDVLIKDISKNGLSLSTATETKATAEEMLDDAEGFGEVLQTSVVTNGFFPVISVTHKDLGTISFEYQSNLNTNPAALSGSFTSAAIDISPQECVDAIDDINNNNFASQNVIDCYTNNPDLAISCLIPSSQTCIDKVLNSLEFSSNATLNLKAVTRYENYIFGYSRPIWQVPSDNIWLTGTIYAGAKISYSTVETSIMSEKLTDLAGGDITEIANNLFNNSPKSSNSGTGVDLGISWASLYYSANINFNNITAPEITYADGTSIENKLAPSAGASLFTLSRSFFMSFQNEFAPNKSLTGQEFQWRTLAFGYASTSWWIPGVEIAKKWNVASGVSYTALGAKLFNLLQANIAVSDERVIGSDLPRATIFSLGIGFSI